MAPAMRAVRRFFCARRRSTAAQCTRWAPPPPGPPASRPARPAAMPGMGANDTMPPMSGENVIGVDVGGTKVAAARIDGADCVHQVEQPTHLDSTEGLIDQIEAVVREVIEDQGEPAAIGLG